MTEDRPAPLRIGLVGCGRVSTRWHLPALAGRSDAEVVAVADVDGERARATAERVGVPRHYVTADDLMADPRVEAVGVCVPASEHAEVAIAALAAGKHVLIEKPLALSLRDCDRVIEAADAAGRTAMVGFNMRWHRNVLRAREAVRVGALGEISLLQTSFTSSTRYHADVAEWRRRPALGGGVVFEQAVHHFDLWRFLLDTEISEVVAFTTSEDEHAAVCARTETGVLVEGAFSDGAISSNDIVLTGGAGRLTVACYRANGYELWPAPGASGDRWARARRGTRLVRELPGGLGAIRAGGDYPRSYAEQWRGFVAAVRGGAPSEATLLDGRRAVEVQLAVLESASSGTRIELRGSQASTGQGAGGPSGGDLSLSASGEVLGAP